jgi:hypothetical protein
LSVFPKIVGLAKEEDVSKEEKCLNGLFNQIDESDDEIFNIASERVSVQVLIQNINDIIDNMIINTWKPELLDIIQLNHDKVSNILSSLDDSSISSSCKHIPLTDILSEINLKMDRAVMLQKIVNMVSLLVDDFPINTTFSNKNPWTIAQRYIEIENYIKEKQHVISTKLFQHIGDILKKSLHDIFNPPTDFDSDTNTKTNTKTNTSIPIAFPTIDYVYTIKSLSITDQYHLSFEILSAIY